MCFRHWKYARLQVFSAQFRSAAAFSGISAPWFTSQTTTTHENKYFRVSKQVEGAFVPEHIFRLKAHPFDAYSAMCNFHQTDPSSHFTKKRLISLMKPNGRVSITGNILKIRNGKQIDEIEILDETNFEELLLRHFNVQLSST